MARQILLPGRLGGYFDEDGTDALLLPGVGYFGEDQASGTTVEALHGIGVDWPTQASQFQSFAIEWALAINAALDEPLLIHWLAEFETDADLRTSSRSRDGASIKASVAWLTKASTESDTPAEWSGGLSVVVDADIQAHWRTVCFKPEGSAVESKVEMEVPSKVYGAFSSQAGSNSRMNAAWLRKIRDSQTQPLTWRSVLLDHIDGVFPVEWGGSSTFTIGNASIFATSERSHTFEARARRLLLEARPRSTTFKKSN